MPVYNYGETFWKAEFGDESQGGHAVTIVGYDKKGLILRNSWGYSWGDGGYGFFPYKDWGIQWEIWTTIDDQSSKVDSYKYEAKKIDPTAKTCFLAKLWS